MDNHSISDPTLGATITRAASKQTYYTIRFLVDKGLADDAYRTYAYFRWVDDWIDQPNCPRAERLAFVRRQQSLMNACFHGAPPDDLTPEECLLADLVRRDADPNSGLHAYIRNMMAVMAFDAERRGRMISQQEIKDYTFWLASAVTEAMHYFIGHCCGSPHDETRYLAVTGAHITHMLRDACEDNEAGYYNLPREVAVSGAIAPWDIESPAYREWVRKSVQQARACFKTGRAYLARVENLRCRIAGYAYIRRFEVVLDCIEDEDYLLRAQYPERKGYSRGAGMLGWALWMALRNRRPAPLSSILPAR